MTDASQPDRARIPGWHRLLLAALGLGLLVPLVVAGCLTPDRRGHGTHQQLGLPPCTIYFVFGIRCPTCGMTTSWSHVVRGQLVGAVRDNAGGALSGVLAVITVPWLLLSALRGRWLGWVPDVTAWTWIVASIVVVTLVDWAVRILVW